MQVRENFPRHPRVISNRGNWRIFDRSFSSYMKDFGRVDTDHKIYETLKNMEGREDAVIVDLMASTRALRAIHMMGISGTFVAVGIDDKRDENMVAWDSKRGIHQIAGDLNRTETWQELAGHLGDQKVNFMMERGYAGLHHVPTYLHYHRAVVSRMWDMLDNDNGLLVLQTPSADYLRKRGIPIDIWFEQLRESGIYYRFDTLNTSKDGDNKYGVLILQKNDEATLPDIMSRLVKERVK